MPPVAIKPDPAATPPEPPAPTGGSEKKTMVRPVVWLEGLNPPETTQNELPS